MIRTIHNIYVYMYININVDIYLLSVIKVMIGWCTVVVCEECYNLGKSIGLLLLFCLSLLFLSINIHTKNMQGMSLLAL